MMFGAAPTVGWTTASASHKAGPVASSRLREHLGTRRLATMDQDRRGLTEADRRLLDRLVRTRAGSSAASRNWDEKNQGRELHRTAWLDFNNLPGYAEQRLLRTAASALGLRDPYFLLHEGDAGASTVIDGRRMIDFSSYDYLGLNHHNVVRDAAHAAIDRYGVSASASRLVAGERPIHPCAGNDKQ